MAEKIGLWVEHAAEHRQTVYQTITSIGLHFAVAFGVTLALTGQAVMSGAVALIEPVVCHFAHVAHEWAWGFREREPAVATIEHRAAAA